MKLKRIEPNTEPSVKEVIRFVIHTQHTPVSVAVGAANTLNGAIHKALGRSGTHYIYKYVVQVFAEDEEVLLTPVFEQEVTKR